MSRILDKCILACGLALVMFVPVGGAQAASFRVLHSFQGRDGANPAAGVIVDGAGNLYGTTEKGGVYRNGRTCNCGTVFQFAPDGTETVLHSFWGLSAGFEPDGDLIADGVGNLYGMTLLGGVYSCGCGVVFKVSQSGKLHVVYSFKGGVSDGRYPTGSLIGDSSGNLYGITPYGGSNGCSNNGCGVVFKVAKDGTETVLYSFCSQANCVDGSYPKAGLIADSAGNLYGTTSGGGLNCSCGAVFKLAPDGTETVLHSFAGGSDGANPTARLAWDRTGNLYGTTEDGGTGCVNTNGCGTVFKIAPDGTEAVLYVFGGGNDGANPAAGLVVDSAGNLYGTTSVGGGTICSEGCGTVFKVTKEGVEKVLYSFKGGSDGSFPFGGLTLSNGFLYGTTTFGGGTGCGCGTVFTLRK